MLSKQPGVWGSIARQAAGCVSIEQAAGCGTPIHRSSDPPTQPCPMCRRSQCSSVGPRSLVLSPPRSTGFSLAFLSPCPTPPCCCLLPCPFVPRPSKELIRGRREGGSLCAVGSVGASQIPSALLLRLSLTRLCALAQAARAICIRAAQFKERGGAVPVCQSHTPASLRHLLDAFCQHAAVSLILMHNMSCVTDYIAISVGRMWYVPRI